MKVDKPNKDQRRSYLEFWCAKMGFKFHIPDWLAAVIVIAFCLAGTYATISIFGNDILIERMIELLAGAETQSKQPLEAIVEF